MDDIEFEKLVDEGYRSVPQQFRDQLENVAIVVDDWPSYHQRRKMNLRHKWGLFGLYEGVPRQRRGQNYFGVLPDKITVFKMPILAASRTYEDAARIVKNTIWHEIAHHFGMSEDEVREFEKKKGFKY